MTAGYILFLFSAIGVVNGAVIAAYQLFNYRSKTSLYLAALILLFCLRVGVSSIYFFEKTLSWDIVQVGMLANVLIGPILLALLIAYFKDPIERYYNKYLIGILVLLVTASLVFPFRDHPDLWDHTIRFILHGILLTHLLLAIVYTVRQITRRKKKIKWKPIIWIATVLMICLGFVISLYTSYIIGPLIATVIFYLGVLLYTQYGKMDLVSVKEVVTERVDENDFSDKLEQVFMSEKLFLNPELKVIDVARSLNTTPHLLSRYMKEECGGFKQYLNSQRVYHAQSLMKEKPHFTIEAIGYESGFKSRSTFFSSFKKVVGMTPSQYRNQQ